jgi:hypothetical protein
MVFVTNKEFPAIVDAEEMPPRAKIFEFVLMDPFTSKVLRNSTDPPTAKFPRVDNVPLTVKLDVLTGPRRKVLP